MVDAERGIGRVARCGLGIALVGVATACVSLGRAEAPLEYFVLESGGTPVGEFGAAPDRARGAPSVGVRRVRVAPYLDVSRMVVRRSAHRVEFEEHGRWGEPVGAGVARVVAAALAGRGVRDVRVAPWAAGTEFDFLVQLDVERFEGIAPPEERAEGGSVHTSVAWQILDPRDGRIVARGVTDHREPGWTSGDGEALARGLALGLAAVASEVGVALAQRGRTSGGTVAYGRARRSTEAIRTPPASPHPGGRW